MDPKLPSSTAHGGSVAVIGAGPAGLITAHTLVQDGFEVQILTRDKTVGGVWREGRVYPDLQINSVNGELSFSSLEMPQPDTVWGRLTGSDLNAYMEAFAAAYLHEKIRLETEVVRIQRGASGSGWLVDVEDKRTGESDSLSFARIVLCTGGCNTPTVPDSLSPAAAESVGFKGPVFHSKYFRSRLDDVLDAVKPIGPEGREAADSVIVVGGGKSAQDVAAYLANEGRKVTVVYDTMDCFLASPRPLPDFIRKSRVLSIMTPHINLRTYLERFLHTTWIGAKIVHAFWDFLAGSAFSAIGAAEDSPLRRIHSPFWSIRISDEGVPRPNRFHMLASSGKIDLVAPARVASYGHDGQSVVLHDGRVLRANAVILATGYSSSWDSIFDTQTTVKLGLKRHAPTLNAEKYHWDYRSLSNPPPAHRDGAQWASSIYRGLVPAKNIAKRDFAINGAVISTNHGMLCEVSAHWISSYFLGDQLRIPATPEDAFEAAERQAAWIRQRYPNMLLWTNESYSSSIEFCTWPQAVDELLEEMDLPSMRSGGNWLTWPFKVVDLKEIATLKEERDAKRGQAQRM
ncbi:FAD/NAD-P-binding domain-containing protein [Artomyces pyxidatus]|uniref:FAD/NAD-P-binding domain-containing protein n=1 Tax=Artomyces pyxidatus TaxID=48021 RepID=A0ACB8SQ67_9AGAM|nr:FAD/NAD-P-binding domain-containing protein [Artomyces pyxidatus]